MKILTVSDAWYPQVNGVVRTYEYLNEELENMGHDTHVIGPADFPVRVPMPGYKEIKLAILPYGRLAQLIEDYGPDHIHIATEGPLGWAARKYCLKERRKFSTSYHTQFPDYVAKRFKRWLPFLHNWAYEKARASVHKFHEPAHALFIAAPSLEEQLKDWGFPAPMHRLTRGVKMDLFYPGEKTTFQNLPGPVALYVGRVAIEKSIEDFLAMDWPGSKVIIGGGPALEELRQKYPDAHFAGVKHGEELAAHYRSADVFVFPSRTDTFGIVLIEALASGLPIAAYDVTGPKDIVTEDFLGVLHEDLSHAAQKALEIEHGPESRAEHVKNYYTWENAARQFLDKLHWHKPDNKEAAE